MELLSRLFRRIGGSTGSDGLQQEEREAMLDLLLYCTYLDNHLSLAEDRIVDEQLDRFEWDSGTTVEIYIATATDRARRAQDDTELEHEFLQFIADRLKSDEARRKARKAMNDLFRSDGQTPKEKAFADKLAKYLP